MNHKALIQVVSEFGFGEPLLSSCIFYLNDRYQWLKVFGEKSKIFSVKINSSVLLSLIYFKVPHSQLDLQFHFMFHMIPRIIYPTSH